ncbi:MAG: class I SAM-dependent methyltransferase [Xanthomonadaceae bacterium]|nr:class I SAM-dependent methyltransferase [Xanthomonadaceae bacterium]
MDRSGDEISEAITDRFSRGDRCITARDNHGNILHSRWLTQKPTLIPELNLHVAPTRQQLYMYDGYSRAEARRQGIDSAMRKFIFQMSRDEGIREVISYVYSQNPTGIKAVQKLQEEVGSIRFIRLFQRWCLVFGRRRLNQRVTLLTDAALRRTQEAYQQRSHALKQWFESWLSQPMDRRSTGFSALPESCFQLTADHIISTLALDRNRDEVLDVGCSSAVVSRYVAPYSRRFHGIDATAGLIADIDTDSIVTGSGEPVRFSVADGRKLPFPEHAFDKVYCSGVLHMLPSHGDATIMVEEMIRVCSAGGKILLAAVPDSAKSKKGRWLAWRRSNLSGKLRLTAAMVTPRPLRRLAQTAGLIQKNPVAFLEFDLQALKSSYESRGFHCQLLDYPGNYWSRDFRTSRSNFVITKPRSLSGGRRQTFSHSHSVTESTHPFRSPSGRAHRPACAIMNQGPVGRILIKWALQPGHAPTVVAQSGLSQRGVSTRLLSPGIPLQTNPWHFKQAGQALIQGIEQHSRLIIEGSPATQQPRQTQPVGKQGLAQSQHGCQSKGATLCLNANR